MTEQLGWGSSTSQDCIIRQYLIKKKTPLGHHWNTQTWMYAHTHTHILNTQNKVFNIGIIGGWLFFCTWQVGREDGCEVGKAKTHWSLAGWIEPTGLRGTHEDGLESTLSLPLSHCLQTSTARMGLPCRIWHLLSQSKTHTWLRSQRSWMWASRSWCSCGPKVQEEVRLAGKLKHQWVAAGCALLRPFNSKKNLDLANLLLPSTPHTETSCLVTHPILELHRENSKEHISSLATLVPYFVQCTNVHWYIQKKTTTDGQGSLKDIWDDSLKDEEGSAMQPR